MNKVIKYYPSLYKCSGCGKMIEEQISVLVRGTNNELEHLHQRQECHDKWNNKVRDKARWKNAVASD